MDGVTDTGKQGDAQDGHGEDSSGDVPAGDDVAEAGGTCTDETQNNAETDIDCGGGVCPKCGSGRTCNSASDCRSGSCSAGKCADGFAATAP